MDDLGREDVGRDIVGAEQLVVRCGLNERLGKTLVERLMWTLGCRNDDRRGDREIETSVAPGEVRWPSSG